jgi:hypothetical protein
VLARALRRSAGRRTAGGGGQRPLRRGLTWDALADGGVHRLKAGRDFDGSVRELQQHAAAVATGRGRAVRTLRDELGGRNHYLWIQFADAEVPVGAPCPHCGSLVLRRLHGDFGFCPACRLSVLFAAPPRVSGEPGATAATHVVRAQPAAEKVRLNRFTDVTVQPAGRWTRFEFERGFGTDPEGQVHLLLVRYPLGKDGVRKQRANGSFRYDARAWPAAAFADVIDWDRLRSTPTDPDWHA